MSTLTSLGRRWVCLLEFVFENDLSVCALFWSLGQIVLSPWCLSNWCVRVRDICFIFFTLVSYWASHHRATISKNEILFDKWVFFKFKSVGSDGFPFHIDASCRFDTGQRFKEFGFIFIVGWLPFNLFQDADHVTLVLLCNTCSRLILDIWSLSINLSDHDTSSIFTGHFVIWIKWIRFHSSQFMNLFFGWNVLSSHVTLFVVVVLVIDFSLGSFDVVSSQVVSCVELLH